MASRCAYASLVQRDATGPAEHSVIIGWVWLRCLLPFGCMSIFLSYSGSALCSSTTSAARMVHCIRSTLGAACIGIGPLRHRVAALVAVARRHEFLDPLSHVCRAGNNLNSLCLMIKWLPAAGYIATSRPRSGVALTGPPGPVQAYFESQQPHGSLSVLPNWPWSRPSQPAMSANDTERSLYLSWGPGRAR